MKRRSILIVFVMALSLLSGCGKSSNLFGEKVLVITSVDMTIEEAIHLHETYEYAKNGMPQQMTVLTESLYEGAESRSDRTASFSYDKEKGEIVTNGLFEVQGENGTQYVTQTLLYDSKGRLLQTQTPTMAAPRQYTYDADGNLTKITQEELVTTISRDTSSGSFMENWEFVFPGVIQRFETVRYDQDERISSFTVRSTLLMEEWMTSTLGKCLFYEEEEGEVASFQIIYEGDEEINRTYTYLYGGESPDPTEAGVMLDEMEEESIWSFSYTYDGDRLLREERHLTADDKEGNSVIVSYEYDEDGHLSGLTQQSGIYTLTYTFTEVNVTDPVIRSFLRTKPSILNGTYEEGDKSNASLFVLTDDNQVSLGLDEHFCYNCARLMPALVTTCPYCGTQVNPVLYVKDDNWTLDGSLLK